jgi:hypothetical protein
MFNASSGANPPSWFSAKDVDALIAEAETEFV